MANIEIIENMETAWLGFEARDARNVAMFAMLCPNSRRELGLPFSGRTLEFGTGETANSRP